MEAGLKRRAFDLCHRICKAVPAADLHFRKDSGFWELVTAEQNLSPSCPSP